MKIVLIISSLIIGFLCIWAIGFIYLNDLKVKTIPDMSYKNILIIFPHPDDEVLLTGGLINKLANQNISTTHIILTKGEKGTLTGVLDESLKYIRTKEAEKVSQILNTTRLIQESFPDGNLENVKAELRSYLATKIDEVRPDLIITYDQSGLYGHPDHMVTSEIVTNLVLENYPSIKLWYATYPKRVLDLINLPVHMAKSENFSAKRVLPTTKIWVGVGGWLKKVKAVKSYNSQYHSFRSGVPKPIPLWFAYSFQLYEYFYEVN